MLERKTFDNTYFEAVTKVRQLIQDSQALNIRAQPMQAIQANNVGTPKLYVKLPVLELSKFDSNYNQWMHFRDLYISNIYSSETICKRTYKNYNI